MVINSTSYQSWFVLFNLCFSVDCVVVHCLSCPFVCVIYCGCPSIYGFWLPIWYLPTVHKSVFPFSYNLTNYYSLYIRTNLSVEQCLFLWKQVMCDLFERKWICACFFFKLFVYIYIFAPIPSQNLHFQCHVSFLCSLV